MMSSAPEFRHIIPHPTVLWNVSDKHLNKPSKLQPLAGLSFQHRLSNLLMTYRNTPHATTSKTPSELFIGRKMHTWFDLLRPDTGNVVLEWQSQQKTNHDRRSCLREFQTGRDVMARNYRGGSAWVPGVVLECHGPLTYQTSK